ncbi:unnamed protein product [Discosporangium mesarthrocarpum]
MVTVTFKVGLCKLGGEVVSVMLVDHVGRRALFMTSSSSVTVFLVLIGVMFLSNAPAGLTLTGLCLFMFSFSLGMGALTFLVAAEIFPLRHRGRGVSLVVCVNRLMSGTVALIFPLLEEDISGGGTFLLFSVLSVGTVWFYYTQLPETAGKTLEEISAEASKAGPGGVEDTADRLGLAPSAPHGTVAAL